MHLLRATNVRIMDTHMVSKDTKNAAQKLTVSEVPETDGGVVAIKNNTRPRTRAPKKKVETQVAVLSPYRFPAIRQESVTALARYAGIVFVAFGGTFSLLNLEHINTPIVSQSTVQTATVLSAVPTALRSDVSIATVSLPSEYISGTVPVSITTEGATSVTLVAEHVATGILSYLGDATAIADGQWEYAWDTTAFLDGAYRLSVVRCGDGICGDTHTVADVYTVSNTEHVVTISTATPLDTADSRSAVLLKGTAAPDDTLSLMVDGTPTGETITADETGAWSHLLATPRTQGATALVATSISAEGTIQAASDPYTIEGEPAPTAPSDTAMPSDTADARMLMLVAALAVVGLGLVLMLLSSYSRHHTAPKANAAE